VGWKGGLGPEAELDSPGWRERMQNHVKNRSTAGRGKRGNQKAMRGNGQGKRARDGQGKDTQDSSSQAPEILDIEGATHVERVTMPLILCSHQDQSILQARKGLDTPEVGGQAIARPGTGQDPPGPAKYTTIATSFLETLDSIKSYSPVFSVSLHKPLSVFPFFFLHPIHFID